MSLELEKGKNLEQEKMMKLADELEVLQMRKTNGKGDKAMQRLIDCLRKGFIDAAKVYLTNEADKFNEYRGDALPLIIEKLYGGAGSPWSSIERKMAQHKAAGSQE